jgi:glycosyltransferase involved in cell wall biosynthesis
VVAEPQPDRVDPVGRYRLFGIVGTWMEEDIIEATVSNAFAQGVERVFLADNDSPDRTIERAVAAGAEDVLRYRTERFEEDYRYSIMNELVRHVSTASDVDHVWWLWFDADEFARPNDGGTIRAMLDGLDRRYRIVGARVLNHYPTPDGAPYVTGTHPIDQQPMCEEVTQNICASRHRKHPLQRWDRHGLALRSGAGFHLAQSEERPLVEPEESLVIHHFPYRDEAVSRARLAALWGGEDTPARAVEDDDAAAHMRARRDSLDAVYQGRWGDVHNFMPDRPEHGVELVDWRQLRPSISTDIRRW